jgi:hypothetical protein
MAMRDLNAFVEQLAAKDLSQPELAIALLWYRDHKDQGISVPVRELADGLHDVGLCSKVNVSRLADQLARHPDVVRGQFASTYKLKVGSRSRLDDIYSPLLGNRRVKPSDSVIPREQFAGRRGAWQELVIEINGCYDHTFYDGAAVLCRRLVEALIVEAFKAKGAEAAIRKPDGYMLLEELAGVVNSGQHIKLSRSAKPGLEPIRVLGNTAAHSPHHITKKQDVDNISNQARVLVSELLNIVDGK